MSSIIVLVLLAVAAWVAWKSKTDDGWDIKKGWWALLAAAVAAWEWVSGTLTSLIS